MKKSSRESADTRALASAFAPMVELLEDELHAAGIAIPSGTDSATRLEFSRWYLEAVQLLEAQVAHHNDQPPMTRTEVELMCRCCLTAASMADAITIIESFTRMLHPRAGEARLSRRADKIRFTLDSLRSERSTASSLVDIAGLFAFKQLFQWLTGGRAVVTLVGIGSMRRSDVLPFLRLFNAPILAQGDITFLEYPATALKEPIVARPGEFDDFFKPFPCAIFEIDTELEQQVSALITASVNQALPIPTQIQVARTLAIPLSTFRRRLSQQGRSFREIRDHCLMESAQALLLQPNIHINQIAQRLGFKDSDTFRRAFKRWTATAPTTWRERETRGEH
jgi:AraC-like DNA-binding protein